MKIKEKLSKIPMIYQLALLVVVGIVTGLFISNVVITRVEIAGESMKPTYYEGDSVLVSRLSTPERGDVIVVLEDDGKTVIKRAIGMPGDTIQIIDGLVYINDTYYPEDYIYKGNTNYDSGIAENKITLDDDEYFMLGDNREVSKDSRVVGIIKESQIVGVVVGDWL